jgi:hypothetical protein
MARLPQPGADSGTWGDVLNDFLTQSLNTDGTLKDVGVVAAKAEDNTVVHNAGDESVGGVKTFSASPIVPTPTANTQAANKSYVDSTAAGGAPDATTTTKGIVQLAGDLSGTATSPQIAAGVIVDTDVNASAGIAQSKVANLTTDLASKETPAGAQTKVDTHVNDTTAAHAASSIAFTPTGTVAATNVQAAIAEVAGEAGSGNMSTTTYDPAGVNQQLVGTTATQTLTNKTITDSTNNLTASGLRTATSTVNVSSATAPSSGQVLTATSGTAATWQTAGGSPDATTGSKGIVQLSGDLAGTATSPQIASGAIVDADVNASAAIAESKLSLASDAAAGVASRRTLGTGATQAAAGNHTHAVVAKTYRLPHTWAISGDIAVASGDTNFILPFFVPVPAGQTVTLKSARYVLNSGTSVTAKLQKNAVDATGYTSISVTTTATTTSADVTIADNDKLALVVTAVSGTPKNMTFTIYLDYTV